VRERGIALMMVLWVLVFLSILSLNFLKSTRWSPQHHNLKEETLTYYQLYQDTMRLCSILLLIKILKWIFWMKKGISGLIMRRFRLPEKRY